MSNINNVNTRINNRLKSFKAIKIIEGQDKIPIIWSVKIENTKNIQQIQITRKLLFVYLEPLGQAAILSSTTNVPNL